MTKTAGAPEIAPSPWLESRARSKAEIAAGESVPLIPILDRLREAADRLDAESDHPGPTTKV